MVNVIFFFAVSLAPGIEAVLLDLFPSDTSWMQLPGDAGALNLSTGEFGSEPLQLVIVRNIYWKRASFNALVWASLAVLGVVLQNITL